MRPLPYMRGEMEGWFADVPVVSAADWGAQNIVLPSTEERGAGPFSLVGREYAMEPLNFFSDPFVTDLALCFGSQVGKTVILMAGVAYLVANDPCGILWAMPSSDLARSFSGKRWMQLVESCPALAAKIPTGKARHDWAKSVQTLGGSVIHFTGGNSAAGLSSWPKRVVLLDESEKFPSELKGEAGAVNLAFQRVKDAAMPKRIQTSTPALMDGPGWSGFQKGDQRRYNVPCPHCGKFVILAWSKSEHLVATGREAWTVWDKECKRENGSYDWDRVHRSARWECPHCQGHIQEQHKTVAVRGGKWEPTAESAKTYKSYHLPSIYASSPSTTIGCLVQKFLEAQSSLEGVRGFINGDLAEPWETSGVMAERTELILNDIETTGEWVRLMTVDVHRQSPEFYVVVRDWEKGGTGRSVLVAVETCDGIANLKVRQKAHGVEDLHLGIDVKDGIRRQEIYNWVVNTGKLFNRANAIPLHGGWVPMEGFERDKRWKHPMTGAPRIWGFEACSLGHTNYELRKVEFAGEEFMDILAMLRMGPEKAAGIRWEVPASLANAEYWRHMDSKHRVAERDKVTGRTIEQWQLRRSKSTQPDHWLDCEVMQIALAMRYKLFPWNTNKA